MNRSIADIRKDYSSSQLLESNIPSSPFQLFGDWWQAASNAGVDEVNAMTLATASPDGAPSARIVLLKGYDEKGFVFFTNYESEKGRQLSENPRAALVFFWKELERQIRITGSVLKLEDADSDEYFKSRPRGSQIGAIASPQSQVIRDRDWIDEHYERLAERFGNEELRRPVNWGGYRVEPGTVEFWQGRPSRLHDRIKYSRSMEGNWEIERLAP